MPPRPQRARHLTDSRDVAEIATGIATMICAFSAASRESFVAATDCDHAPPHRDTQTMAPKQQRIRHLTDSRDVAEIAKGIETMISAFSRLRANSFVASWNASAAPR